MGGVIAHFTRHRTLANLLMVVLIVAGLLAASRIRSQFFPDVVVGTVTVSVVWQGAGAEDVDAAVVQLLEPALMGVDGVASTSARAREGLATILLEFEPGRDMAQAAEDVQAAVDGIRTLPEGAERPEVRRGSWRDRVTDVAIHGPVGVDQLARIGDEFATALYARGITRATLQGLAAPEIQVEVPTANLIRHGLGLREIATLIATEVNPAPAGDVAGGAARVRTGTERRSPEAIAAIPLRRGADGSVLTVGDVARITVLASDRVQASFVGANPAVLLRVDRADAGDAIRMQTTVQEAADALQPTLPAGVTIELVRTRAEGIRDRLRILLDNAAVGLTLVVILLFLFLNARTAFWVAAGIPVALSAALAVMWLGGLTINMISLFALIITLGIIVDDAIVVGEHADHRARNLGEAPVDAAENAARRMAQPVLAATLTTVVAFLGIFAVTGQFGEMISHIPFTVIAVLIASLVECFLILPHHMSHALASQAAERWYDAPSRVVNRGFGWVRERLFRPFVGWVIAARYPAMALAVLALAWQAAFFLRGDVQWRFFNAPEQGSITGNFSMLPGATRADSLAMMRELQRATEAVAERYQADHGAYPVKFLLGQVGGNSGRSLPGAEVKEPDQLGSISIELIDPDLRPYSSFEFLAAVQEEVRAHPRMEELSFRGWRSGPGGDALSVRLSGADAAGLKAAAEALKAALAPFPPVSALEDSLAYDKTELILRLTPRGQALGFTVDGLGRTLRDRLSGIEAATWPEGPRTAALRVKLPDDEATADFLDRTLLLTAAGQPVPLAEIVSVEARAGFSTVRRENGQRVVTVTGDIAEDDPVAAAEVQRALETEILPRIAEEHGVDWRLSGLAEQERAFLSDSLVGLILCIIGIYVVLAWIFASWTRPFVVMAVIPFGLVGAIWGHWLWEVPLSMFSVVGLLGMTGIIVNDSIVLVTTIQEHARTRPMRQAIIEGATDRLRPVLLTTLTTVLGLAPLLYETSSQAQFLKPTVITLVYGLGFGMFLVLLIVPALTAAQEDFGRRLRALRRAWAGRARLGAGGHVVAAGTVAVLVTLGATMGSVALTGETLAGGISGRDAALAVYLGLAVLVVTISAVAGAVAVRLSARGNRTVRPPSLRPER
ncbi:MAG: efflux RND transporter permease subunit [Gemmobacter sp.]